MTLIDLFRQPWFQGPICPFTLVYWAVLATWGGHKLLRSGASYKRRRLGAYVTALFMVGFIHLMQDMIWVSVNNVRWVATYPQMVSAYLLLYPRNILGLLFLYVYGVGGEPRFKFTWKTLFGFAAVSTFIIFLFALAPDPSLTDWAYATRNNYSPARVYTAFFLSHVCLKIIIAYTYTTVFVKPRGETREY